MELTFLTYREFWKHEHLPTSLPGHGLWMTLATLLPLLMKSRAEGMDWDGGDIGHTPPLLKKGST